MGSWHPPETGAVRVEVYYLPCLVPKRCCLTSGSVLVNRRTLNWTSNFALAGQRPLNSISDFALIEWGMLDSHASEDFERLVPRLGFVPGIRCWSSYCGYRHSA